MRFYIEVRFQGFFAQPAYMDDARIFLNIPKLMWKSMLQPVQFADHNRLPFIPEAVMDWTDQGVMQQ